jgi:hypothetical protein
MTLSQPPPGKYICIEQPPGVCQLWKDDSLFMLFVESGQLWEMCLSKPFGRQIPGTWRYEFKFEKITEVSLVDKPANPFARVAMWK